MFQKFWSKASKKPVEAAKVPIPSSKPDISKVPAAAASAKKPAPVAKTQNEAKSPQAPKPEKGRSKQSQEKSWSEIRKKFEEFAALYPEDHISSQLVRLRELDISRRDPGHFYRTRDLVRPLGTTIMAGIESGLDNKACYPDVAEGRYVTAAISPVRYLMNCVREDTQAIVELGSGWSCNLFQLYVGLGLTRSRSIDFHGAEYTEEGQATGQRIAAYDKQIRYSAHGFDYRTPDTAFLAPYEKHILAFTKHSIEQVDVINPDLYAQLANLKARVTLVHFEPVGWQRRDDLLRKRLADDRDYFLAIGEQVASGSGLQLDGTMAQQQQQEFAAWWSWRLKYNTNLMSIIRDFENRNAIDVAKRIYDFSGVGNVLNPTTLLHCEFNKDAKP